MSAAHTSIDGWLDEWGRRLFNVPAASPSRQSSSTRHLRLGLPVKVSTGGRLSTAQARAIYVRPMTYC
ncbi:MAG: hypothetical protein OEV99_00900 [Nitrospira sp.]|nr:hypothetical protein [Nitrospira sp.]MDH4368370.1 hypothetical protein [Nitrospira sp.]MDH5347549.1 hypothetical protein [Nitrospira sp.]MDH5496979.1 hypothetical protein [Nitrospira sp.]